MGEAPSVDRLLGTATALRPDLASWAGTLCEQGRERFARIGLPHRRLESWKYSDLSRALGKAFDAGPAAEIGVAAKGPRAGSVPPLTLPANFRA